MNKTNKKTAKIVSEEQIIEEDTEKKPQESQEEFDLKMMEQILTKQIPPKEEIKDLFTVVSKDFDNSYVKEVHLPKFLMQGSKVCEKGNMFIVFEGEPLIYATLLRMVSKGTMKELKLNLLSEEGEVLTSLIFPKPKIKAVDFGSLLRAREDERELKIEIDFENMVIDDVSFAF